MDTKVICICGDIHLKSNHSRHLQSQKHIKFMNPNDVQIKQKQNKPITCECGSTYIFKNEIWKAAHERTYAHCKLLNYKLDS